MKLAKTLLLVSLPALIWGCFPAPLILVGASGGAVYSTTNDRISDTFVMSKEQAFEVMIGILNAQEAKINISSISEGKIEAQIDKSFVFVNITQASTETIKLVINAKKHVELLPDRDTAVKIYRLFIKETAK